MIDSSWNVGAYVLLGIAFPAFALIQVMRFRRTRKPSAVEPARFGAWALMVLAVIMCQANSAHLFEHGLVALGWTTASLGGALALAAFVLLAAQERARRAGPGTSPR